MIRIQSQAFYEAAKKLIIKANTILRADVENSLKKSIAHEEGNAKKALEALLENAKIARNKNIPLCQDTGYVTFFLQKGPNVCIEGNLEEVLNKATEDIYSEMPYRQSMVSDPIKRTPSSKNIPANLYAEDISENKAVLKVIIKGAGSDNASALKMFLASAPKKQINDWIIKKVSENGPNACPPLVIGIGVGGSFEKSVLLSKKAFFRSIDEANPDPFYAVWEEELKEEINKLRFGPQAFGGKTSALSVLINQAPVHIASLPVAVNIGCYLVRTASMEVGVNR